MPDQAQTIEQKPSTIEPTIGRKIWYWSHVSSMQYVRDSFQAFDAEIVYCHDKDKVTVVYRDHFGGQRIASNVLLFDPTGREHHGHGLESYCTWMPYQVKKDRA